MVVRSEQMQVHPVYAGYFADPFVWKVGTRYYAIGTGEEEANGCLPRMRKVFPLLTSEDFCNWESVGRVLERPDESFGANFWAPAVAVSEGRFYLYYSVGHGDKNHQLRAAVADRPEGPYKDLDRPLIDPGKCSFAIDPHPFMDEDGAWYLFWARDFLDEQGGARPGTALVAARMKSMTELAEEPRVILRARHDWQRFEKDRLMYGRRWDWHTLEGPCVWKHGGQYFCFYSGPYCPDINRTSFGSRRFQRQIDKIKAHPCDPFDFRQHISSRMIHRSDQHLASPSFSSSASSSSCLKFAFVTNYTSSFCVSGCSAANQCRVSSSRI